VKQEQDLVEPSAALPEVLLVGDFRFPEGDAGANLMRGHSVAIQDAGYSVGMLPDQVDGRQEDRQPDGGYAYRGVPYWPVRRPRVLTRLGARLYYWPKTALARGDDAMYWLSRRAPLRGVRAIIYYPGVGGTVPLTLRLRAFCRRNRIQLFTYIVEWQEPGRNGVPRFSHVTIDAEIQRRLVNRTTDAVICISTYLENYYRGRGVRTALIPALLDLSDPLWTIADEGRLQTNGGELRLVFSGTCIRERHDIILRAVVEARRRGFPVVMEYVGSSRADVAAAKGVGQPLLQALGDGVRFHGCVAFDDLLRIVASASFGLLMREDSKWSRACFPSKVPEFLALGVPIICNLTSDLGTYLRDSDNAFLVEELSVDALCRALERAATMGEGRYREMKAAARKTAALFDASCYGGVYRQLIGEGRPGSSAIR
jgi:glycosyltransferase involved in cell wall biosynthesis